MNVLAGEECSNEQSFEAKFKSTMYTEGKVDERDWSATKGHFLSGRAWCKEQDFDPGLGLADEGWGFAGEASVVVACSTNAHTPYARSSYTIHHTLVHHTPHTTHSYTILDHTGVMADAEGGMASINSTHRVVASSILDWERRHLEVVSRKHRLQTVFIR
jgi:hypothetical protein